MQAKGEFEVELKPLPPHAAAGDGAMLGRMSIDKTFHGDLTAVSQGEMLTAMTPVDGSAGYVAIERVEGTLHGKAGTFVLQHFGIMHAGDSRLILEVVPGSGTGELAGIAGAMAIDVKDGRHRYTLDYQLASGQ